MHIHIYNPENDMALANGTPGYTPPANIIAYRQARWDLPRQWAAPGDIVWDHHTPYHMLHIPPGTDVRLAPWGWSPALAHQLRQARFPDHLIPTPQWLSLLRSQSSRTATVPIQHQLGHPAHVCHTIEQVRRHLAANPHHTYILKSPWSSSGKGITHTIHPHWPQWTRHILERQGAVILEPRLDRIQDFAMEFQLTPGHTASYVGLSIFTTDPYGHYLRNTHAHASEAEKTRYLTQFTAPHTSPNLQEIQDWYLTHLPHIAPWYQGPVGIDMLITRDGEICPCIEINWRMTMGMATLLQDFS